MDTVGTSPMRNLLLPEARIFGAGPLGGEIRGFRNGGRERVK
jgi:hypothetical protein